MDTSGRIPWAVLGIAEDASFDDARRAFRALVKGAHPDVGGDPAVFASLVNAFKAVTAARTSERGPSPSRRRPTPYDWANRPVAPAPRIWAERAPGRRSAAREAPGRRSTAQETPCFADVLARETARETAREMARESAPGMAHEGAAAAA